MIEPRQGSPPCGLSHADTGTVGSRAERVSGELQGKAEVAGAGAGDRPYEADLWRIRPKIGNRKPILYRKMRKKGSLSEVKALKTWTRP